MSEPRKVNLRTIYFLAIVSVVASSFATIAVLSVPQLNVCTCDACYGCGCNLVDVFGIGAVLLSVAAIECDRITMYEFPRLSSRLG